MREQDLFAEAAKVLKPDTYGDVGNLERIRLERLENELKLRVTAVVDNVFIHFNDGLARVEGGVTCLKI